ncbi:hypothetical protein AAHC03_09828 [Spirometra sp. Aus1]
MWDLMAGALGLHIQVHGSTDHLNANPHVIVCNHQSFLDILSLTPVWPRVCTFVAKRSVRFYGPFGLLVWFLKAILIDRNDRMGSIGEFQRTAKIIRDDQVLSSFVPSRQVSIIIFPEGTRGCLGNNLLPFKKGAFHLAISAQVPIQPVVIEPYSVFYDFEKRISRSGVSHVHVLSPIPTTGLTAADVDSLLEDVHAKMEAVLTACSQKNE